MCSPCVWVCEIWFCGWKQLWKEKENQCRNKGFSRFLKLHLFQIVCLSDLSALSTCFKKKLKKNQTIWFQTRKRSQRTSTGCELTPTSITCFLLDLSLDAHSTEPPLRSTVNSGLDWLPPNWRERERERREEKSQRRWTHCSHESASPHITVQVRETTLKLHLLP